MTVAPPEHPKRLVFLGTPEMAVPSLRALVTAFDVVAVVTRADKRRGRGSAPSPSPVKAAAVELGLPVRHNVDGVVELGADLGVVVAFGRLIKPPVLARLPMVNLHFSLLPRWRGAAPVERAILAGDSETGVCVMAVEEALDTGAVYRRAKVPIGPHQTAAELRAELVEVGTPLLVDTLVAGLTAADPQHGEPTYAEKLRVEELRIDWSAPAVHAERVVRVGGAWTTWRGKRLKIWRAQVRAHGSEVTTSTGGDGGSLAPGQLHHTTVGTGEGVLELLEVQNEGKARQPAEQWARGARPTTADRLGL